MSEKGICNEAGALDNAVAANADLLDDSIEPPKTLHVLGIVLLHARHVLARWRVCVRVMLV